MTETDIILINGLEFYAYHGATDAEQTIGHRYCVDIRLSVDIRAACASDRLTDTVSYADVAKRLVEVGAGTQYCLLEALAQRMADTVFAEFAIVQGMTLRVVKICPPLPAIVEFVGVEIERRRVE